MSQNSLSFSVQKSHSIPRNENTSKLLDTKDLKLSAIDDEFSVALSSNSCDPRDAKLLDSVGPRKGTLRLGNIEVQTPIFMPVGTVASVKALTSEDVSAIGYKLILGNTYHLYLRPGLDVLSAHDGLHKFMNWPGAILTDSGGFQVMSLAKIRKLTEEGVHFANHINGARIHLNPESVVQIQDTIDSDIQMVLDECTPYPATHTDARLSMERSMRWAARARVARSQKTKSQFGIVQGGMYTDLRVKSAKALKEIGFEGYAIGGLSVGESKEEMRRVLAGVIPFMPQNAPRYLMGVGAPDDLVDAVLLGIDMFDCVMPTRNARNGSVFVRTNESPNGKIHIKNAQHRVSLKPLDSNCQCFTCKNYTRSYLRHLFVAEELAVHRLMTIHNLQFMWDLMAQLRSDIDTSSPLETIAATRQKYVGQS